MPQNSSVETVCVVVPLYNEVTTIQEVVTDLLAVFPDVVCVDDGSTDGCGAVAAAAGATVLRHVVNLGAGAATQTGIDHALAANRFTHIITFDADGQHRVEDAVAMWRAALDEEVDVVLGTRFIEPPQGMPQSRRALLRLATHFTRATTGLSVSDTHVGLRAFSRRAAEGLRITLPGMAHASEVLAYVARAELSYCEVPIEVNYTPYSLAKGQRNVNAINIAVDLLVSRLYALT